MYAVFEEDMYVKNGRVYDLYHGEYDTLDEAIKEADKIYDGYHGTVPIFVADADDYYDGNYDYLYVVGYAYDC